ncbi:single-stranded DNA-binding protein [Sporosarcina sp. FSL W7-1349]|uniref:single-stranded DNA-binding protein n=1 Tax=Sporosarcina sp. FSL W7-1349 TaxID=2921561 RepID=UPI0030F7B351
MLNRVVLVGRLTKDPEVRYSQSGVAICRFNLAVNRAFKNASGEQEADFPSILTFRKTAENVANFLKKGSLCGIDGRIQTGSYEKDGVRVYTTEVIADSVQFLEPKSNRSESPNSSYQAPQQQYGQQPYTSPANDPFDSGGPIEVTDDDLPF